VSQVRRLKTWITEALHLLDGNAEALHLAAPPREDQSSLTTIGRRLPMNGYLMWGIVLPILLVVAGIVAIRRRKGRR
jgi:hypothetical protein